MIGIFGGILIGLIASLLLNRLNPAITIIFGAVIGYLLENIYYLKKQIKILQDSLSDVKLFINKHFKPGNRQTQQQLAENSPIYNLESIEHIHLPSQSETNNLRYQRLAKTHKELTSAFSTINSSQTVIANKTGHALTSEQENRQDALTSTKLYGVEKSPTQNSSRYQNFYYENDAFLNTLKQFFIGENAVLRIGIIILFLGIVFLLKYVSSNFSFPIPLRLALVTIIATAMLWFGWALKSKNETYALSLQGASIAILYLNVFATMKLTNALPVEKAFPILILLCIASAALAILQNAKLLAIIATIGSFFAPILTAIDHKEYQLFFSYYLLLNSGILAIAWYKAWRSLNIIGFILTLAIGIFWTTKNYQANMFWHMELFLFLFLIQFVLISIFFSLKQTSDNYSSFIDGILAISTPIIVFALQTYLIKTAPHALDYGLAITALCLAILYLFLNYLFEKTRTQHHLLLSEITLGLAALFTALTIPLLFNHGLWTSSLWALEGLGLIWLGIRQNLRIARIAGLILQLFAGLAFLVKAVKIKLPFIDVFVLPQAIHFPIPDDITLAIINSNYISCFIIFVTGLFSAYLLYKNPKNLQRDEHSFRLILLYWSLSWWFVSGVLEIRNYAANSHFINYSLLFILISCISFYSVSKPLNWPKLSSITNLAPITIVVIFFITILNTLFYTDIHPFSHYGYITWTIAFSLFYTLYYFIDQDKSKKETSTIHTAVYLILIALLTWEVIWQTNQFITATKTWHNTTWILFVFGTLLSTFMFLTLVASKHLAWPFKKNKTAYLIDSQLSIATTLSIWIAYSTFFSNADPQPLPYLPLLNPLELSQIMAFSAILTWRNSLIKNNLYQKKLKYKTATHALMTIILFIWLNSLLVRILGYWVPISFSWQSFIDTSLAQTTFSITWILFVATAMTLGTKYLSRGIWIGGTTILVITVSKLFLIDLANIGTLGRIISFIAVGTMLLIVGYLSPLPPKDK